MTRIIYPKLSYVITGLCFAVHNELGRFCNEKQYADALEKKLKENGLIYEREYQLPQSFQGERLRRNVVDFLVDDVVIVEIKAKTNLEKADYYQVRRYLQASRKELGLLVTFRRKFIRPKRILNTTYSEHSDTFAD